MSLLEESRDGDSFDEIAKARGVDGKLRELLRWGIPEPGGAGGARSFPTSFLATVLLSTQAAVSAVLKDSLGGDPDLSGKERITSALNAVAQDPLFKSLLQQAQERRDEAYTPTGGRRQSKASPFKTAAERVNMVRTEKESWQAAVDESESIETSLRELAARKGAFEESLANEEALRRRPTHERTWYRWRGDAWRRQACRPIVGWHARAIINFVPPGTRRVSQDCRRAGRSIGPE